MLKRTLEGDIATQRMCGLSERLFARCAWTPGIAIEGTMASENGCFKGGMSLFLWETLIYTMFWTLGLQEKVGSGVQSI